MSLYDRLAKSRESVYSHPMSRYKLTARGELVLAYLAALGLLAYCVGCWALVVWLFNIGFLKN